MSARIITSRATEQQRSVPRDCAKTASVSARSAGFHAKWPGRACTQGLGVTGLKRLDNRQTVRDHIDNGVGFYKVGRLFPSSCHDHPLNYSGTYHAMAGSSTKTQVRTKTRIDHAYHIASVVFHGILVPYFYVRDGIEHLM